MSPPFAGKGLGLAGRSYARSRGPCCFTDTERTALEALLSSTDTFHGAALAFAERLAASTSPVRLLVALRILLQDGFLQRTVQQVQALFLLYSADPLSGRQLLVEVAAAEAALPAVRLLALQLLQGSSRCKHLSQLSARQFLQQCDVAALQGAPTLLELQQQHLSNCLEGPQACFGAAGGPGSTLPQCQLVALGLLQAWSSSPCIDSAARQQAAAVASDLSQWLCLQQALTLCPASPAVPQAAGAAPAASTPAGSQQHLERSAAAANGPTDKQIGAGLANGRHDQRPMLLESHPLTSLPSSPQPLTLMAAAAVPPTTLGALPGMRAAAAAATAALPGEQGGAVALVRALQQAQRQPLVPASQHQLLSALQSTATGGRGAGASSSSKGSSSNGTAAATAAAPSSINAADAAELLESLRQVDASHFGSLVENNPLVASEVVSTALRLAAPEEGSSAGGSTFGNAWGVLALRFLDACSLVPMSTQSIECMTLLVNRMPPPDEALHTFVSRCMASVEASQEPGRQGRLLKLLCAFVGHLVQRRPSSVLGMHEELSAFCIQFSRAKEAAALFGRLQLLAQEAAL